MKISPIDLAVFKSRFTAICEEMGVVLCRSSFSPNIKERKDFSCALFDPTGHLVAQAAHIPVHLGSMPLSVKAALRAFRLRPGDTVILNDPYAGGTHLPDITLVSPVFIGKNPAFFVANRAHHADVGGKSPGSMPLARHLEEEGVVIRPTLFSVRGKINSAFLKKFLAQVRHPRERRADLNAQLSANQVGAKRLGEWVEREGFARISSAMRAYQKYEEAITHRALTLLPRGDFFFEDFLDDDGITAMPIRMAVDIRIQRGKVLVDLKDCAPQVAGPVNATRAITLSCVAYVFRCLVLALTGEDCLSLKPIQVRTRKGTIVDARYPAPVAGGNVETSQRLVDLLFGALAPALPRLIPAASQGTMNNVALGSASYSYYETLGGGTGAGPGWDGTSAIHSHMTNTLNTPVEALENELPLRIRSYKIRRGSGGTGFHHGGDGLIREYEFLEDAQVSLLTERRTTRPYGLKGGQPGEPGANWLIKNMKIHLPSKFEEKVRQGDILRIETPGGGGWGKKRVFGRDPSGV